MNRRKAILAALAIFTIGVSVTLADEAAPGSFAGIREHRKRVREWQSRNTTTLAAIGFGVAILIGVGKMIKDLKSQPAQTPPADSWETQAENEPARGASKDIPG